MYDFCFYVLELITRSQTYYCNVKPRGIIIARRHDVATALLLIIVYCRSYIYTVTVASSIIQ